MPISVKISATAAIVRRAHARKAHLRELALQIVATQQFARCRRGLCRVSRVAHCTSETVVVPLQGVGERRVSLQPRLQLAIDLLVRRDQLLDSRVARGRFA